MAIIANIQHGDVVRHRDGKTYRVSEVVRGNDGQPSQVSIAREGEGYVFVGTPAQAREQGFAFGSEAFLSNGRPISHYDIPAAIDMAERAAVGCLNDELGQRNTVLFAISAGNEVVRLQHALVAEQARFRNARDELSTFRTEVREAIVQAQKDHDLCREGTNAVLENLGLDKIKPTFTVEVTRDSDGNTIATIRGVEAEDGDAAESEVKDNFTVTATVSRVKYEYTYDGEGESDFDEDEFTEDELDDGDDEYASNHMHDLTFSATEE